MASYFKRTISGFLFLSAAGVGTLQAELLELKPHKTTYNLQSKLGLPISATFGDPVGSNGLAPTSDATPGQFTGFYSAGAVVAPSKSGAERLNSTLSLVDNIDNLDLPRSSDGSYSLINGASGAAIMGAQASIMFGGIISVPESIFKNGSETAVTNPHSYWDKEPFKAQHKIVDIQTPVTDIVQVTTELATDYGEGDLIEISNVTIDSWNGVWNIFYVSSDKKTFRFQLGMSNDGKFGDKTLRAGENYNPNAPLTGGEFCREIHSSDGYHYSHSAKAVFAIQAGPVGITWKESSGVAEQPEGDINIDWVKVKRKYYKLYNNKYLISSSAAKPVKKYYWNVEPSYEGPQLILPDGVSDLDIVYNINFPGRYLKNDYNQGVPDTRKNKTLWVEKNGTTKMLRAINATGRVFVEILGPVRDGVPKHLGFEIVDVYQTSVPEDRVVFLGEKLLPYKDPNKIDASLSIEFEGSSPSEHPKTFMNVFEGKIDYYAIDETKATADGNDSDRVVAFWNQLGMANLKWPVKHAAYEFKWPENLGDYSHYIRPNLGESGSEKTAIQLPTENAPIVQYQDRDSSGLKRAKIIKENYRFVSWLGPDSDQIQTHRTLVRYTSDKGGVRYERIFSWLDESINQQSTYYADGDTIPAGKAKGDIKILAPEINTKEVRNLNLWPKITIDGNMDSQILIYNSSTGQYTGQNFKLRQQYYTGLGDKAGVEGLTVSPKFGFPRSPDSRQYLDSVKSNVTNQSEDFAVAIEGYLSPVESAEYQFSINYSGSSELKLSMGNNPVAGFNKIAATGDDIVGESKSPYIYLDSNNHYFLRGLMRFKTENEVFSISFRKRGDDDFMEISAENLFTGLRVQPLDQDMFTGDKVYFSETIYFTFTEGAKKGLTLVAGQLEGVNSDNESEIDGLIGSTYREALVESFNDRVLLDAPRYLEKVAYVGQRLNVPDGEYGSGQGSYWAGFIDEREGDLLPYHEEAYINPLDKGFASANQGSIIPVNADPSNNTITVQWFRKTMLDADPKSGFGVVYWPSVTVKYRVVYPSEAREIVLASNDGSGPLSSLEAKGAIYVQNDRTLIGYNPNEEHALMVGGQAYALRNDLNIYEHPDFSDAIRSKLKSGGTYSSNPFVLLEFTDSDGKVSVTPFKVLNEKGEEGLVFDYLAEAGSILQPPMPLPLLPKPVDAAGALKSYEVDQGSYDSPPKWNTIKSLSYFSKSSTYSNTTGKIEDGDFPAKAEAPLDPELHFTHYEKFTYPDRKSNFWVYRGRHERLNPLKVGKYDVGASTWGQVQPTEAVANKGFEFHLHASQLESVLQLATLSPLPNWLTVDGLSFSGQPEEDDATAHATGRISIDANDTDSKTLVVLKELNEKFAAGQTVIIPGAGASGGFLKSEIKSSFVDDDGFQKLRISDEASQSVGTPNSDTPIYQVVPVKFKVTESRGGDSTTAEVLIRIRKEVESSDSLFKPQGILRTGYVVGERPVFPKGRPPYLAERPSGQNSFKMKYYYFAMNGFAYPRENREFSDGDVLPYLAGTFVESIQVNGEPADPGEVVYRPIWPKTVPVLSKGDTLTLPKYGLPAMRGQSSAEVLYQQSVALGGTASGALSSSEITVKNAVKGNWLKVVNPDGSGYSKGDYSATHITIVHADGVTGDGYDAYEDNSESENYGKYIGDTWVANGIAIKALEKNVPIHARFHFENGAVLVVSRNHAAGETKIYGKLIGKEISHGNLGVSGGLMVASSTHEHFNFATNGTVEMSALAGYSDSVGYGINGILPVKALSQDLKVGNIIKFNNGVSLEIIRDVAKGASGLPANSYIMRPAVYLYPGFIGTVITANEDPDWKIKVGTVLKFSNGAEFTISAVPEKGHIAFSGSLTADVANDIQNFEEVEIELSSVTTKKFEEGEPFYFNSAVFTLTQDAEAGVNKLIGIVTRSEIQAGEVGFNPSDLIKASESVKLIDPTREKVSYYVKVDGETFPPSSVPTSYYQGKIYFPNLDPHLSKRVFFDPNRGKNGALVFIGKFMDELVGEKYLQLNVLSETNYSDLIKLCNSGDPAFTSWKSVIKGLSTEMEYFKVKLGPDGVTPIKGVYEKDPNNSYIRNVSEVAEVYSANVAVDSYALSAVGPGFGYVSIIVGDGRNENTQPIGEPVTVHIIKLDETLHPGSLKVVQAENPLDERLTFFHSPDLAGKVDEFDYQWRKAYPVDGTYPPFDSSSRIDEDNNIINSPGDQWLVAEAKADGFGENIFVLGKKPGIDTLMDLYISMRYKPKGAGNAGDWSEWTKPQLAEGWIKRVLAGINPFNQRVKNLFNNEANLDYSMLTQAGKRWEGDVALSLSSINDFGLIEIYETVLNKGRNLSINAGINHNGANNALLLVAGYLNDLYMMVGNDAYADAYNPTIGFATSDGGEYGDFSTALFAFKGQLPTLLDEELALLRGRDDFMAPGVEANPVYNRLFWNYTRGIDSGEVIYALNYNIKERDGSDLDGTVDAADATAMYPQGHGDAFGHYMTAIKGYYKLIADNDFTWVPQSESVLILGQEVAVDYMDERKFAAAAAALARSGNQVLDLTWRKDYIPGTGNGWMHLGAQRENGRRSYKPINVVLDDDGNEVDKVNTERSWGVDHWASRLGQGSYLNWLVGNAMIPSVDDDPNHEGIQKIDRTTVPELFEIPEIGKQIQITLDNAAAGLNPLGLPENSVAFDIDPTLYSESETHFDQIYGRAVGALGNAVSAFDASKNITSTMRVEEDTSADLSEAVNSQELAYKHQLIEIYGTPYPEDIGPGRMYSQGYDGPDLLNFSYIDFPGMPRSVAHDSQTFPDTRKHRVYIEKLFDVDSSNEELADGIIAREISKLTADKAYNYNFNLIQKEGSSGLREGVHYVEYEMEDHGLMKKPDSYISKRSSPGALQTAAHNVVAAFGGIEDSIRTMASMKRKFDLQVDLLKSVVSTKQDIEKIQDDSDSLAKAALGVRFAADTITGIVDPLVAGIDRLLGVSTDGMPETLVIGFSNGGDFMAPVKLAFGIPATIGIYVAEAVKFVANAAAGGTELGKDLKEIDNNKKINRAADSLEIQSALLDLEDALTEMRAQADEIDGCIGIWDEAARNYRSMLASGDRLLKEREIFRKRTAAVVQGYRVRDAALRIFRNEKLERYKSMLDLASRYTFLAAKAYDYETGLLDTSKGKRFISRIVASRALGVIEDGTPQFAGSNNGDPGLSSVLAEMSADWEVLRGRLGFNNPDVYGTTFSLRTENYRLLPNTAGNIEWKQILENGMMENLLVDEDARQLCMQLDLGDGLPVPGIMLTFRTTIQDGYNFFGKKLAAGDHAFSPSLFATKILGVGVALEGYEGIDYYDGNGNVVSPNPSINPNGLSATPYVYLVPVGVDAMRSPPLGDQSGIRTWFIQDATIPTPFNIGGSDFDSKVLFQSADSLTERMFNVRKHQAFRPVSDASVFTDGPILPPSNIINNRLVGRSAWNSKWKLIIPGKALLYDSKEGLDIFLRTVNDIKIHFETYSYSGN